MLSLCHAAKGDACQDLVAGVRPFADPPSIGGDGGTRHNVLHLWEQTQQHLGVDPSTALSCESAPIQRVPPRSSLCDLAQQFIAQVGPTCFFHASLFVTRRFKKRVQLPYSRTSWAIKIMSIFKFQIWKPHVTLHMGHVKQHAYSIQMLQLWLHNPVWNLHCCCRILNNLLAVWISLIVLWTWWVILNSAQPSWKDLDLLLFYIKTVQTSTVIRGKISKRSRIAWFGKDTTDL